MFLIFVRKYRKHATDQWRVLYEMHVCFRGDFTIKAAVGFLHKLAWKMCHSHTLKHFILIYSIHVFNFSIHVFSFGPHVFNFNTRVQLWHTFIQHRIMNSGIPVLNGRIPYENIRFWTDMLNFLHNFYRTHVFESDLDILFCFWTLGRRYLNTVDADANVLTS